MSRFKPQASFISKESLRNWRNAGSWVKPTPSKSEIHVHDTYADLKKHIKEYCEKCIEVEGVFVVRSRRGQWGEWFEFGRFGVYCKVLKVFWLIIDLDPIF